MRKYIHERDDWPEFRWDIQALSEMLAGTSHRQGLLIGSMKALGFQASRDVVVEALTDEVQKSSEIEGERLDREQVRSSLARHLGMDAGALPPVDRYVEGVVEVMLDATQLYDSPITFERLFRWHSGLFPADRILLRRIHVGQWRDDAMGPMQVVSGPIGHERVHYEAPGAARLEAEMTTFLAWFNGPELYNPLVKAALAHLWFVTIHPFDDGNGRIARTIADMALARADGSSQRFYSMSPRS